MGRSPGLLRGEPERLRAVAAAPDPDRAFLQVSGNELNLLTVVPVVLSLRGDAK